ncbi:hypothetical protein LEN26_012234 [Aphanomyces euteiches]|nr:hypothetical protein LEN26_012234 [Aphanomyces euteiches]
MHPRADRKISRSAATQGVVLQGPIQKSVSEGDLIRLPVQLLVTQLIAFLLVSFHSGPNAIALLNLVFQFLNPGGQLLVLGRQLTDLFLLRLVDFLQLDYLVLQLVMFARQLVKVFLEHATIVCFSLGDDLGKVLKVPLGWTQLS